MIPVTNLLREKLSLSVVFNLQKPTKNEGDFEDTLQASASYYPSYLGEVNGSFLHNSSL